MRRCTPITNRDLETHDPSVQFEHILITKCDNSHLSKYYKQEKNEFKRHCILQIEISTQIVIKIRHCKNCAIQVGKKEIKYCLQKSCA